MLAFLSARDGMCGSRNDQLPSGANRQRGEVPWVVVNFDTDVDKTVDIDKNVTVNVNKNVATNVRLDGSLASAEASADAVGGGNGNGNGTDDFLFIIDDASDPQSVIAQIGVANPATGFIPITGTSIPDGVRTFDVNVLSGAAAAELNAAGGRLGFSNGNQTISNQRITWDSADGEAFSVLDPDCDPEESGPEV